MSVDEIRRLLDSEKLIIGTDRTMKALKEGNIKKIFLASNVNPQILEDIEYYKELSGVEVVELKESNDELGIVCKKQFSISVIGLKK